METERKKFIPWWLWSAVIGLAVFYIFSRLLRRRSQALPASAPHDEVKKEYLLPSEEAPQTPMVIPEAKLPAPKKKRTPARRAVAVEPEDFTRIEGIGPKINSVLHDAGFNTYAEIANTAVERLRQVLREANVRIGASDTWPEQARLAAVGNWDGLAELQATLKGGRRAG